MIDSVSEQLINDLLSHSEAKSGLHQFSLVRSFAKCLKLMSSSQNFESS